MARKRKSNTGLWVMLAVGAIAAFYWLKTQVALIQIAGISIPFQKLEGTNIRLGIKIDIINASSLAARITGFTGFIINPQGAVISNVFMERPAVVNRYQQAQLDFTSVISGLSVATEIYNIISSGQKPDWKGYVIKGQLRVYGLPVPVESTLI